MNLQPFMSKFPCKESMSSEDMFVLDENSEGLGIPRDKLMENAGAAVASIIIANHAPLGEKDVHVFCGLGNNGGDGFVAARHLAMVARTVHVHVAGDPAQISTTEAMANWNVLQKQGYSINIEILKDSSQWSKDLGIDGDSIIVDALLGAGIKGTVREPVASAIRTINAASEQASCPVIAVDVPSGLNMDDGTEGDPTVKATRTVTFHLQKNGLVGKDSITGWVDVVPIGVPPEADWLIGKGDVKLLLKKRRDARSFKGMNGKVLVIGGSEQYSGAPILSAIAAIRCGIDLVNLCVPAAHAPVARSASTDLIVTGLDGPIFTEDHIPGIESRITWADTVLAGPGMGRDPQTASAVVKLCDLAMKAGKKLVLDADGLKAVASDLSVIDDPNVIITPHAGEFSIVSGISADRLKTLEGKLDAAFEFTRHCKCQVLMKGPEDIVMNADRCKINLAHTPAMTVGGTGDVLAGITAALAALFGTSADRMFEIACAAIHVNGLIGQLVEQQQGGPFITASMMLGNIGTVLSRFM